MKKPILEALSRSGRPAEAEPAATRETVRSGAVNQRIVANKRRYNQWVADETLEDFALRYTAKRARKWSDARIANTALGIVSFLALEAIGGAITLQYGFTNSLWAILVVCALIFLCGLPICYYAARYGLDIDLLTRGAGFGYIGSTISSLIYASFTFIFFALEAAIMSMALRLLFGIPEAWAYVISALVVIPLVTHGITRISRFQLWTQPIWIILQVAPLLVILLHHADAVSQWTQFSGQQAPDEDGFNLLLFGAAAAVIFPLIAQNAEQVDYLRFLPDEDKHTAKWWAALILSGPGWTLFGVLKLLAGSFLAVLALQHGMAPELADDPTHMYLVAYSYITENPDVALVLVGAFVIISQLKINVTNAYAGSIAWSNFFSRLTHSHPGRIVWLVFNVAIALLLMELGLYHAFESILITYSTLVLAWIGSLVADLLINNLLGLRPKRFEFKRGHLYDINPVGVVSTLLASIIGICGQLELFGPTFKALSPFVALFLPFFTAPLIAYLTDGRYYHVRSSNLPDDKTELTCTICENTFEREDMSQCPAYSGPICSLCCALDASCGDQCRSDAHLRAQTDNALGRIMPGTWVAGLHSTLGKFLLIMTLTTTLTASLFSLVYFSLSPATHQGRELLQSGLLQTFLLLFVVTGVLVWLYVLAQNSKRQALEQSEKRTELLHNEVLAHEVTSRALQETKEAAVNANQAKSRYLSGVSHELRTPLNTLLGYAQLLEADQGLGQAPKKAAAVIRRNGQHLADVIEGLLEISKIEARKLDLHRDQVKLATLLEQIVEVFSNQAHAKNLEFHYHLEDDLPETVFTDENRLRQTLVNLLSNAVKFTTQGEVCFCVDYRNEVATFRIRDTGVGIQQADLSTIFEPFERLPYPEIQHVSGTGLGLTISMLLSNMMGGDLAVDSHYGKGTTFTLKLMLPVYRGPQTRIDISQQIIGYEGAAKTLLVVDDQADHRGLMADFLAPLGFRVLVASNAKQALDVLADNRVDLFLLDIFMPGMNGWELAARIHEQRPTAPIVMISANATEVQKQEMASQPHVGYLIKPIHLEALLAKIGSTLELIWQYQAPEAETPGTQQQCVELHELEELADVARIGHLSGVEDKLKSLGRRGLDAQWLDALQARADACDFKGLINLLEQHRHES